MATTDRNLIDRNLPDRRESWSSKVLSQVLFLNVLHDVPTNAEVVGNVLDGHVADQFKHIPSERSRVSPAWIGHANANLSTNTTGLAADTGNLGDQPRYPATDRQPPKRTLL